MNEINLDRSFIKIVPQVHGGTRTHPLGDVYPITEVASAIQESLKAAIQEITEKLNTTFPLAPLSPLLRSNRISYSTRRSIPQSTSIPLFFLSLDSPVRFLIYSSSSPWLQLAGLARLFESRVSDRGLGVRSQRRNLNCPEVVYL